MCGCYGHLARNCSFAMEEPGLSSVAKEDAATAEKQKEGVDVGPTPNSKDVTEDCGNTHNTGSILDPSKQVTDDAHDWVEVTNKRRSQNLNAGKGKNKEMIARSLNNMANSKGYIPRKTAMHDSARRKEFGGPTKFGLTMDLTKAREHNMQGKLSNMVFSAAKPDSVVKGV